MRRFTRDYIDRRYVIAEYLLPILVVSFVVTTLPPPWAGIGLLLWLVVTLLTVIDEFILVRRLKKELARRFPDAERQGHHAVRPAPQHPAAPVALPKPQIERGARSSPSDVT